VELQKAFLPDSPKERGCSEHSFGWSERWVHFSRTAPSLKEEETDAYQKIWAFVQSFSWKTKIDKRGNPLMNADGTLVTEPYLINTPELVVFEDPDDCLGSYTSFCFA